MVTTATEHPARLASQRSAAAVQAKDKDAWLALFADDAVVQDPVGKSFLDESGEGHRGHDAIGAFFDNNIAPVETISFELHDSFAAGDEVANVATIHMMLPGGATPISGAAMEPSWWPSTNRLTWRPLAAKACYCWTLPWISSRA